MEVEGSTNPDGCDLEKPGTWPGKLQVRPSHPSCMILTNSMVPHLKGEWCRVTADM